MKIFVVAALLAAATVAHGQAYKCKDARGRISYSSDPCPSGQQSLGAPVQNTAPVANPDVDAGLWETVMVARPRASHPKQNPQPSAAELKAMGEMGYLFGKPMKTLKCGASPVKDYLSRYPVSMHCRSQIAAAGGTCAFEEDKPGGTGILSNKEAVTMTGNYRNQLNVKSRFIRVYSSNPSDPVVDESDITIRFLGNCKSDMKPGSEYLVQDDGSLKPMR